MKALAFGEILWDVIGDERKIGGAPLNVLGHIVQLGGTGAVISAIGQDELGNESIEYLESKGIDTKLIKRTETETGKAIITLKDGIPSYRFTAPSAWDEITLTTDELSEIRNTNYDAFIYGTLAARSLTSRRTWEQLLNNINASALFFDVNLRLDFYSKEVIEIGARHADILKVNDEELPIILELLEVKDINELITKYNLKLVLLTSGKDGSDVYTANQHYHQEAGNVEVVDTVGAGDSLSAGFLYFLTKGDSIDETLRKASILADYTVGKRGAIPEYDEEIRNTLR